MEWNVIIVFVFRPLITEEENRNLSCVFFYKFCQISTLLLHLLNSSRRGAVGSASAWQTRGRGFEPVLMRHIFSGKKPRCIAGVLLSLYEVSLFSLNGISLLSLYGMSLVSSFVVELVVTVGVK